MDSSFEIGSDYGELIRENNKLQKLVTDLNLELNPCQIVVIGSQSAGKSSVLEKIVGKNFLPTGENSVTMRPLHLNLSQSDVSSSEITYFDLEHQKTIKQPNLNLKELAEAIRQANSFQGPIKFISEPIQVSISGPNNPDLTLIDLPGVVADDDRQTIIDMIKPIIQQETSIILAVSSANDDFKNSNAIHLAQKADEHGERTIGVLTKVDIIDSKSLKTYKDILIEFAEKHKCLKYIAVKNSPETRIEDAKSEELDFFKRNKDVVNGSDKLKSKISMELIKKIKKEVPDMESKITENLSAMEAQYDEFEDFTNEELQYKLIVEMAKEFEQKFLADLGYASSAMRPETLSHGARIFKILNEWFSQNGRMWKHEQKEGARWYLHNPNKQKEMLFDINIKQQNVRGGFYFTGQAETTMREIIQKELDFMIQMPNNVIRKLTTELRTSYIETSENLNDKYQNFPNLISTLKTIIRNHVRKAEKENKNQIKRYFDQEKEYINSGHKDFEINFERKQIAHRSGEDVAEADGQKTDEYVLAAETSESNSEKLNILNFQNDSKGRKRFYQSSKDLIGDMWEDDAIILEAILKHLQIIQDSLSDKLKKIIHFEIFHSTKIFVEQGLANALIDEWKRNKDVMSSDESQQKQILQLENDIEKNKKALEIVSGMTKMIRNFQNQDIGSDYIRSDYIEDDIGHLRLTYVSSDDESDEEIFLSS